jgi:hypothetical protein
MKKGDGGETGEPGPASLARIALVGDTMHPVGDTRHPPSLVPENVASPKSPTLTVYAGIGAAGVADEAVWLGCAPTVAGPRPGLVIRSSRGARNTFAGFKSRWLW